MTTRHRLNRGGHRQANAALYRAVIARMQFYESTKTYLARRTAEGKTKREIIRRLKRLLAREIWLYAAKTPHGCSSSSGLVVGCVGRSGPCGDLVVGGCVQQAAMEDARQPVAECAQGLVVGGLSVAAGVVVGAGAG